MNGFVADIFCFWFFFEFVIIIMNYVGLIMCGMYDYIWGWVGGWGVFGGVFLVRGLWIWGWKFIICM